MFSFDVEYYYGFHGFSRKCGQSVGCSGCGLGIRNGSDAVVPRPFDCDGVLAIRCIVDLASPLFEANNPRRDPIGSFGIGGHWRHREAQGPAILSLSHSFCEFFTVNIFILHTLVLRQIGLELNKERTTKK